MTSTPPHLRKLHKTKSVVEFAEKLTDEQIVVVRQIFDVFDEDKDGTLNRSELRNVLKELQVFLSDSEYDKLFNQLDANHDNTVSKTEFVDGLKWIQMAKKMYSKEAVQNQNPVPQSQSTPSKSNKPPKLERGTSYINFVSTLKESEIKNMKDLFDMVDANKDGVVSKSELYDIMVQMNVVTDSSSFDEFWVELDKQKKGHITFDQFLYALKWLQKGMEMTHENNTATVSVSQKNEMLTKYSQELLDRVMQLAKKYIAANDLKNAAEVLKIIDFDVLQGMNEYVDGTLLSKKIAKDYQDIATALKQSKK
mmetsp:Transcript_25538/g.35853  ORF Transcript_25538/g.35853 Transcript_25538/m.35853 type:complete len:309 (-) Transcript_25538:183-1109(-)